MTVEQLRERWREEGLEGGVVAEWGDDGWFQVGVRRNDGEFFFQDSDGGEACRSLLAFARIAAVAPSSVPRIAIQDLVGRRDVARQVARILGDLTSQARKKEPPPPSRPAPGNVRVNDATKRPRPVEVAP